MTYFLCLVLTLYKTSRNVLFAQWLQSKGMKRRVTAEIRKAKNDWFQQKAKGLKAKL